jgi:hypothetical protein
MRVMKVKIDFIIGRRFGVVEQTIFRLVLNGLTNTRQISNLLWIFSDEVIANALRRLVNQQILKADAGSQTLSISDAVTAIIETCLTNSYVLNMPESLADVMLDKCLLITDIDTKEAVLAQLLPNIKLGFSAKALDFIISERGETDEE